MKPRRVIVDLNIIGPKMSERRAELKLTQKDLLARLQSNGLDINATTLSEIERQVRAVRDCEIAPIADSLQLSIDDLLGV